jgi:hypothetical protein
MGLVVEPTDGRVLDGPVHPFDLPVGPRVIELREAMLDAMLGAGEVERVGTEGAGSGEHLPNFLDAPAAMRRREVKSIVREHRVDRVRHPLNQPPQKVRSNPRCGSFVQFGKGELADAIDSDEEIELALVRPDLREVDMNVPQRIGLEYLPYARAFRVRETADAVALQKVMQRRPREVGNSRLEGVKAVIKGQERVPAKGEDQDLLLC